MTDGITGVPQLGLAQCIVSFDTLGELTQGSFDKFSILGGGGGGSVLGYSSVVVQLMWVNILIILHLTGRHRQLGAQLRHCLSSGAASVLFLSSFPLVYQADRLWSPGELSNSMQVAPVEPTGSHSVPHDGRVCPQVSDTFCHLSLLTTASGRLPASGQ